MTIKDAVIIEINEETALSVFDGKVKLGDVLSHIASEARSVVTEAETLTGRKEITALAYKVSRSKTLIDSVGKSIVAKWKNQCKVVDGQRKEARDFLDALRDEIRKPVTDYEDEQKRIQEEAIRKEEEEREARLAEIERREAELLAKEEAARAKEIAEREEKERAEREAQIAKEAAERARIEAEQKAANEKLDAERREREAIEAKERAEREAKEAKELAELRAEQAKKQAALDAAAAVAREQERVAAEARAEEHARIKREQDKEHKAVVNIAAMKAICTVGLSEESAKAVVRLIIKGGVPHVRIEY